jgi:hypothetical protein
MHELRSSETCHEGEKQFVWGVDFRMHVRCTPDPEILSGPGPALAVGVQRKAEELRVARSPYRRLFNVGLACTSACCHTHDALTVHLARLATARIYSWRSAL